MLFTGSNACCLSMSMTAENKMQKSFWQEAFTATLSQLVR